MQTFLPYARDFEMTARVLDRQRLGKQRVEGLQILRTLTGVSSGWKNHPAVKMWVGHEELLAHYVLNICKEWVGRGYKDTCADKVRAMFPNLPPESQMKYPEWMYNWEITESHRSNLSRKLPTHYARFWPSTPTDLPYIWPV